MTDNDLSRHINSLPIEQLMPHTKPMVLLDRLVNWGDYFTECLVEHQCDNGFWNAHQQIPAYVGLEYMAQTIAVYSGILATLAGEGIRVGYLLGTRKFDTNQHFMHRDQPVTIRVEEQFRNDDNVAVFDCELTGDNLAMRAQLKVIQPHSIEFE